MVKDNKQLTDTLAEMNKERLLLQNRIAELENKQPSRIPIDDLEARVSDVANVISLQGISGSTLRCRAPKEFEFRSYICATGPE